MDVFPPGYDVSASTWLYLSLVLIAAVFFRFNRFWSLRNLDLCLLLSVSPGLLLVREPYARAAGFTWLFAFSGLALLRLLLDPVLGRRPHLGQNLNASGMGFLCAAAFALLTTQAFAQKLPDSTAQTVERADSMLHGESHPAEEAGRAAAGPAGPTLVAPVVWVFEDLAARVIAMTAHLAVVLGLMFVGRNLFGDMHLGLAMATLYLLLPGTALDVGEVNHVLPSALVVWAVAVYRRPMWAGGLLGLACGTMFFPVFLLPLWAMFYGKRGALRFVTALILVASVLLTTIALTSQDQNSFLARTLGTINLDMLSLQAGGALSGFWTASREAYRLPVMVSFFVMLTSLTFWPRRKSIEHLLAHSAAILVGTQFWYPQEGGVYLLWYLPLLLIVTFRPRLAHLTPPEIEADAVAVQSRGSDPGRTLRKTSVFKRVYLFR